MSPSAAAAGTMTSAAIAYFEGTRRPLAQSRRRPATNRPPEVEPPPP